MSKTGNSLVLDREVDMNNSQMNGDKGVVKMYKLLRFTVLLALVVVLMASAQLFAQAPNTLLYQGKLTDSDGAPITDSTVVRFCIYRTPETETATWIETQKVGPNAQGIFSVELGSVTPFSSTLFDGDPLWLGITVVTEGVEMLPRQQILSAPYAINTANVPGIANARRSSGSVALGSTMQDIETVSITIPAPGYIVLEGRCFANFSGTTSSNTAIFQIDQTAGGSSQVPYYVMAGLGSYATTAGGLFPVYVNRVYYKAAGTHTFRLEGYHGGSGSVIAVLPWLTATYYPKSYGTVEMAPPVPGDEEAAIEVAETPPANPELGE